MRITDGALEVRIAAEPDIRQTKSGKAMVRCFSVSRKRRKGTHGGWEDDPYYGTLRVSLILFGNAAEKLIDSGGLSKGAVVSVTDGLINKPKRDSVDIEVVAFNAELLEAGEEREVKKESKSGINNSTDEAFATLGGDVDLPF